MQVFNILVGLLLVSSTAWANCVTLDLTPWIEEHREFLLRVAAFAAGDTITITRTIADPVEIGDLPVVVDDMVELCAPTADISGLDSAALQSAAQGIVAEQAALTEARQVEVVEARAEMRTNTLCDASPALLGTRIDAEKAAIKTEIDAIADPQTRAAMTLLNNRTWGAMKFMVKCDKSRATIGGE